MPKNLMGLLMFDDEVRMGLPHGLDIFSLFGFIGVLSIHKKRELHFQSWWVDPNGYNGCGMGIFSEQICMKGLIRIWAGERLIVLKPMLEGLMDNHLQKLFVVQ